MSKKQTVQEFLNLHKNEFFPLPDYQTVFANMIGNVYGDCRCENEKTGLYEIEISANESTSGNPVLFTFRDPDHQPIT